MRNVHSAAMLAALTAAFCAAMASLAHAAPILCPSPGLVICESFDSSAASFSTVGGQWAVSGGKYRLSSPADVTSLGVQNRALHSSVVGGDFTLNVEIGRAHV